MRRALLLWLILLAAYAATLGLDAFGDSDYGGDEPHYLLAAESIVEDGDLDVKNQYAARAYERFYPYELDGTAASHRRAAARAPRRRVPAADRPRIRHRRGAGGGAVPGRHRRAGLRPRLPAGPAGGARSVGIRRGARGGPLAPVPGLRHGRLSGADRRRGAGRAPPCSPLRLEERVYRRDAFACFAPARRPALARHEVRARGHSGGGLCHPLPPERAPANAGARRASSWRRSASPLYVGDQRGALRRADPLCGRRARRDRHRRQLPGRLPRRARTALVALLLDRDYGLLRWAPALPARAGGPLAALPLAARRPGPGAAAASRARNGSALMCAGALGAQMLVAAFLAPTMFGFWFPPRHLLAALPLAVPLVAWGTAALPARGQLARRAHRRGGVGLALRRRAAGLRRARDARAPTRRSGRSPARSRSSATRRGRTCWPLRSPPASLLLALRRVAPLAPAPPAPRARGTPGSARTSGRRCGGGRRSRTSTGSIPAPQSESVSTWA